MSSSLSLLIESEARKARSLSAALSGLRPCRRSFPPSMTITSPASGGNWAPAGMRRPFSPRFMTSQPVAAARISGQRSASP